MIPRRILPLLLSAALPTVAGCMRQSPPPPPPPTQVAQAEEPVPPMPDELLGAPNGKADPPYQLAGAPVVVARAEQGGSDAPALPPPQAPSLPSEVGSMATVAVADPSPGPPALAPVATASVATASAATSDAYPSLVGAPVTSARLAALDERRSRASPSRRARMAFVRRRRPHGERWLVARRRTRSPLQLAVYRHRPAPTHAVASAHRRVELVRIASASKGWLPSFSRLRTVIVAWIGAVRI